VASDVSQDAIILVLRLGIVALLYVFLLSVIAVGQRQLRAEGRVRESPGAAAHLVVIDPGTSGMYPGDAIALQPVTRIGRADGNTLIVEDEFISAHHAMVLERNGAWWVRDDGSTNGTLVNGVRVTSEVPLHEGDELQVGQVRMRLAT
jgi:hypothetical protein